MRLKLIFYTAMIFAIILSAGLSSGASPLLETPLHSLEEAAVTLDLSGRVYEGAFGDESKPLAGVRVELRCSNDPEDVGKPVSSAISDSRGWYGLPPPPGCEFYNIVMTVPEGYLTAGADSAGGKVIDDDRIRYDYPLGGSVLTGNKFWVERSELRLPLKPLRPLVPVKPQKPETVSCPGGCECMTEEMAKREFGRYERCSDQICGFDDRDTPMYCFRPAGDVPGEMECPIGCECLAEEVAAEKFGRYEWCSDEICGYDNRNTPKYCFRPAEGAPEEAVCPEGCECMTEEMAKEKFGKYERCSPEICGYDDLRRPMYCFRPIEDVPPEAKCPQGCECLAEEVAAEKFGGYEWCSDEICGIGVGRVPKYCFKPVEDIPEECPQGCECLAEEVAAEKFGRYEWCSDEICGFDDRKTPKYCFRPAEPAPEVPPESCELFFSTEEDFIAQGPSPPDGNPVISDGDLLGPGCIVFARNRELLAAFKVEADLGLDAVDVIDAEGRMIAFSTELNDPLGRFSAGDLLATSGLVIPHGALLAGFDIWDVNLGLDAVHFVGDPGNIINFLDKSSEVRRDEWLEDPGILPEMLREYGVDIWFSTEGTPSGIDDPIFLDGDLLSARDGIVVARNALLLPPVVPAGIPNRGVDFGLDAVTAGRDGKRELIRFSTEILYEGNPAFSDGDVLLIDDGMVCTNEDLVRCFEPAARDLGLDALCYPLPLGEQRRGGG